MPSENFCLFLFESQIILSFSFCCFILLCCGSFGSELAVEVCLAIDKATFLHFLYWLCGWCCLTTKLCLSLSRPHGLQLDRLPCPWDVPGKITRVGCQFSLQGISLMQGLNPHPLHWQADAIPLNYQGSPLLWVNYF